MFEQRSEEGRETLVLPERPEEGPPAEALRVRDGFSCYSLEVLRLLED